MTTPAPAPAPTNLYQEAVNQSNSAGNFLGRAWDNMQVAFQSFTSLVRQQSQHILNLEAKILELEKNYNEKTNLVNSLEGQITEMRQSFLGQIAQKQGQLAGAESRAIASFEAAKQADSRIAELRKDVEAKEARYKLSLERLAILIRQSINAKKANSREASVQTLGIEYPERNLAAIESALKRELEERSEAVRLAAAAVAQEAVDANSVLRKAYNESQARVVSLEEQLQIGKDVVAKMINPLYSSQPPDSSADRTLLGSASVHGIVSGTYRPKPPQHSSTPTPLPQDASNAGSSVTPSLSLPNASGPPNATPSENAAIPAQTSTHEVIDLTLSPRQTSGASLSNDQASQYFMRPPKRPRLDSQDPSAPPFPPYADEQKLQGSIQNPAPGNPAAPSSNRHSR